MPISCTCQCICEKDYHRHLVDNTSNCSVALQATVCAKFGLECIVYMGAKDMERQKLNVFRMRLLGAQVRAVKSGTATLKDATSEAIRDWVTNVETTHYILGSAAGPHPYPMMVGILRSHTLHSRVSRSPPLPHDGGYPALSYTALCVQPQGPTPTP